MADDEKPDKEDQTEEPTEKRLQDAKEEGNVPRSQELTSFILLGLSAVGGVAIGGWIVRRFNTLIHIMLTLPAHPDGALMVHRCMEALTYLVPPFLALFALLTAGVIGGSLAMGGWVFSAKKLAPDIKKFNPVTNLGQLFTLKGLSQLFKDVLKIIMLAPLGAFLLMHFRARMTGWLQTTPSAAISDMGHVMLYIYAGLVLALVAIVAVDVPVQRYSHKKDLKMTKKQVKDENKETEGDPHMKAKRKKKQRDNAKRSLAAVPAADAVVTNPDHVAVAIRYDRHQDDAPVVVAKGADLLAQIIRQRARQYGVTVVEVPPLARALHKWVDIDEPVPEALFDALAAVLAYVYQLRAAYKGLAPTPEVPEVGVPDELRVAPSRD